MINEGEMEGGEEGMSVASVAPGATNWTDHGPLPAWPRMAPFPTEPNGQRMGSHRDMRASCIKLIRKF